MQNSKGKIQNWGGEDGSRVPFPMHGGNDRRAIHIVPDRADRLAGYSTTVFRLVSTRVTSQSFTAIQSLWGVLTEIFLRV